MDQFSSFKCSTVDFEDGTCYLKSFRFKVEEEKISLFLEGKSLAERIEEDRVFYIDYKDLEEYTMPESKTVSELIVYSEGCPEKIERCHCFNQRVRNDRVVSQIFLLTQSVFEMNPPRLWELQS